MLLIDTIMIEFSWTFLSGAEAIWLIFLYLLLLSAWAVGTLAGGFLEYNLKALGFESSLYFTSLVFLRSFPELNGLGRGWDYHFLVLVLMPITSLILSLPIFYYLRNFVKWKEISLLSVSVLAGFISYYLSIF